MLKLEAKNAPWHVEHDGSDAPNDCRVVDSTGRVVAELSVNGVDRIHSEQMLDSAHCVARIPDMLTALQKVRWAAQGVHSYDDAYNAVDAVLSDITTRGGGR